MKKVCLLALLLASAVCLQATSDDGEEPTEQKSARAEASDRMIFEEGCFPIPQKALEPLIERLGYSHTVGFLTKNAAQLVLRNENKVQKVLDISFADEDEEVDMREQVATYVDEIQTPGTNVVIPSVCFDVTVNTSAGVKLSVPLLSYKNPESGQVGLLYPTESGAKTFVLDENFSLPENTVASYADVAAQLEKKRGFDFSRQVSNAAWNMPAAPVDELSALFQASGSKKRKRDLEPEVSDAKKKKDS